MSNEQLHPHRSKKAFVFPGQGAFYGGVLQFIRVVYPCVEEVLATVEKVASRRLDRSLCEVLGNDENTIDALMSSDPAMLQLGIYTVSVAAHEIMKTEGIEPSAFIGHSFGEIAALVCAGVYTIEQGADIVCDRIESLAEFAPRDGAMAAISTGGEQVRKTLDAWSKRGADLSQVSALSLAVENHQGQTVVSGPVLAVNAFMGYCRESGLNAHLLRSPYAFHNSSLLPVVFAFARRLAEYPAGQLRHPVFSPILGRYYEDGDRFGELLAGHLILPVKFSDALHALYSEGIDAYIECGALGALGKTVIAALGPTKVKTFSVFNSKTEELATIRKIVDHFKGDLIVNATSTREIAPHFEAFWNQYGTTIVSQIKSEVLDFVTKHYAASEGAAASSSSQAASPAAPVQVPAIAETPSGGTGLIPRSQLFGELVNIYAEAMEYPPEVFNETVELEGELGIDSVKQTELLVRISQKYGLPPLPKDFRMGDYKAMGQIVDFVFAHQGKATALVS